MSALWDRVDKALADRAPHLFSNLRLGANLAQVSSTEKLMGLTLPEEVKAAYLRHDGSGLPSDSENLSLVHNSIFVWGNDWYSLQASIEVWKTQMEIMSEMRLTNPDMYPDYDPYWDNLPIRRESWNRCRIPLGRCGGGVHTYVDLAPGGKGNIGQIITDDGAMEGVLRAPSFNAYLNALADHLESGEIVHEVGVGWLGAKSRKRIWNLLPELKLCST
jgi:cell wall assembly regulator SMI1